MNLQQAIQNIGQVLQTGRIMLPEGPYQGTPYIPLIAQEHAQLQADFGLLVKRAQLADELEKKLEDMKEEETEDGSGTE